MDHALQDKRTDFKQLWSVVGDRTRLQAEAAVKSLSCDLDQESRWNKFFLLVTRKTGYADIQGRLTLRRGDPVAGFNWLILALLQLTFWHQHSFKHESGKIIQLQYLFIHRLKDQKKKILLLVTTSNYTPDSRFKLTLNWSGPVSSFQLNAIP